MNSVSKAEGGRRKYFGSAPHSVKSRCGLCIGEGAPCAAPGPGAPAFTAALVRVTGKLKDLIKHFIKN